MSDVIDIESDPFLQLLTDALRAGPGSPEWHQAVSRLRAGNGSGISKAQLDDYQLLVTAREHLESGRSYREIRPGPGFTRKVLAGIDAEVSAAPRGASALPAANLIAILGSMAVLAVLGVIGFWLLHSAPVQTNEDLANIYFGTTVTAVTFDGPLPGAWCEVGPMPVDPAHGLRPASTAPTSGYDGGGIVTTAGLAPDQPFAVEATLRINHLTNGVIPQVFVTDQPDFDSDRATSPHELVWVIRDGKAQAVLPNGQFSGSTDTIKDGQTITVRVVVGREAAQIISGRKTLFAGPSQLAGDRPRFLGVRFLRRGNEKKDRDAVTVQSIKVMQK